MPAIRIGVESFDNILASINQYPDAARRSLVRSINRTLPGNRNRWQKNIREKINLSARDVKRQFTIKRASSNNIRGEIIVSRKAIGLIKYDARQLKNRGVTFRILAGGAREKLKHAFIRKMKNGFVGVFVREGKDSKPIRQLYSSAVVEVAQDYLSENQRYTEQRFIEEFFNNLDFYLGRK